ncbi:hypothetical protein PVK06_027544 [Gossypium arboreum]|uniref:Uncharacterized protein n=1 Tax=Gossypium arboreum TaxID=29729 RepID=A0ABR0P0U7_GOSAR|nr:hypothetical protein PVK06_027544 [Gossypium arboreum]
METSPQKQAKVKVPKSKTLKGKRARLYIIRRCIFMLLCWKDQGDKNLGPKAAYHSQIKQRDCIRTNMVNPGAAPFGKQRKGMGSQSKSAIGS